MRQKPTVLSREIVAKALESGQPVLADGPGRAICLPLAAGGAGKGAIYLDRAAADGPFTAADLEFLAAAGGFLNHVLGNAAGAEGNGDGGNGGVLCGGAVSRCFA